MIAGLIAAAALAAAQPKPHELSPAELKAENAKLHQQVGYLMGLVHALQAQRDQNANQAADAAARGQGNSGQ